MRYYVYIVWYFDENNNLLTALFSKMSDAADFSNFIEINGHMTDIEEVIVYDESAE